MTQNSPRAPLPKARCALVGAGLIMLSLPSPVAWLYPALGLVVSLGLLVLAWDCRGLPEWRWVMWVLIAAAVLLDPLVTHAVLSERACLTVYSVAGVIMLFLGFRGGRS